MIERTRLCTSCFRLEDCRSTSVRGSQARFLVSGKGRCQSDQESQCCVERAALVPLRNLREVTWLRLGWEGRPRGAVAGAGLGVMVLLGDRLTAPMSRCQRGCLLGLAPVIFGGPKVPRQIICWLEPLVPWWRGPVRVKTTESGRPEIWFTFEGRKLGERYAAMSPGYWYLIRD